MPSGKKMNRAYLTTARTHTRANGTV